MTTVIERGGLNEIQVEAAYLLGEGLLRAEVARKVGVDPRTVTKWTKRPDFIAMVEASREVDRFNLKSGAIKLQGDVLVQLQAAVDGKKLSNDQLIKLLAILAKLTGTNDPTRIEHSGSVQFDLSGLSPDQLAHLSAQIGITDAEIVDEPA